MQLSSILFVVVLWVSAIDVQAPQIIKATASENLLHAVVRVGQESGVPVGIIQPSDGALCQTVAGIVPDHPSDAFATMNQIAKQAGYETVNVLGTLIIRPLAVQGKLKDAMQYRYPYFPEMTGTMRYMGGILRGWLEVSINGASGFALSSASATDSQSLKFSRSDSATVIQIASQIVSLGPKGVWILSEEQSSQNALLKIGIDTYSYKEDVWALDRLPCLIPPVRHVDTKPEAMPK